MAEQLPRQTHERGCNIKFNGVDGEYGKSASLWLAEMERHREKGSSPSLYLQHIDHHLEGEAAQWMRNSPSVMALIYKGYMDIATEFDVDTFHGALCERFKLTDEEAKEVYEAAPIFRFLQLRQETSEDLANYYNRVRLHFHDFHDFHDDDRENDALTPPQQLLRSMAIYLFIRGLRSDWSFGRLLRLLQKQHISHHSVSLYQAFKIVEAQMKIVDMEKKIEQSREKEQERKRKDVNDEKAQDNAKNSKHMIMNLKLSGPTQDDEFPASSDLNEGTLVPSDNEGRNQLSHVKPSVNLHNPESVKRVNRAAETLDPSSSFDKPKKHSVWSLYDDDDDDDDDDDNDNGCSSSESSLSYANGDEEYTPSSQASPCPNGLPPRKLGRNLRSREISD